LDPLQHDDIEAWLRDHRLFAHRQVTIADLSQGAQDKLRCGGWASRITLRGVLRVAAHELLTRELLTSPFLRSHGSADTVLEAWILQLSRRGGEQATITLLMSVRWEACRTPIRLLAHLISFACLCFGQQILQELQERKARLQGLAATLDNLDLPDRSASDLFKQAVAFQLLGSLCPSSEGDKRARDGADPVGVHQDLVALCKTDDVMLVSG
jgi:hypothetical protein